MGHRIQPYLVSCDMLHRVFSWLLLFSHSVMSDSFATPWTVAHQAPLSMGFPRQEHWSGLPFPSPGDLPDPGIKPVSLALAGGFFITEPPGKPEFPVRSAVFHFIRDAKKRTLNTTLKKCLHLWKTCPEGGGVWRHPRGPLEQWQRLELWEPRWLFLVTMVRGCLLVDGSLTGCLCSARFWINCLVHIPFLPLMWVY